MTSSCSSCAKTRRASAAKTCARSCRRSRAASARCAPTRPAAAALVRQGQPVAAPEAAARLDRADAAGCGPERSRASRSAGRARRRWASFGTWMFSHAPAHARSERRRCRRSPTSSCPARASSSTMRVGLLTGGGDCPGLNAVIRAVVRRGLAEPGHSFVGFRYGWAGVLDDDAVELTLASTAGILPRGGTILGTSRTNPYADGATARRAIRETLRAREIDALIPIGGEDTLGVALRLHEAGIAVVGVPKTIDNDLGGTDVTFGFQTAVQIVTDAIDRLHTTAESHNRVMVRRGDGPARGLDRHACGDRRRRRRDPRARAPVRHRATSSRTCARRHERGRSFSIVVVAEGATPREGTLQAREGHARPTPSATPASAGSASRSRARSSGAPATRRRVTILGHVQRGGSPVAFDRVLATRFGVAAMGAALGRALRRDGRRCAAPRSSRRRSPTRCASPSCSTPSCTRQRSCSSADAVRAMIFERVGRAVACGRARSPLARPGRAAAARARVRRLSHRPAPARRRGRDRPAARARPSHRRAQSPATSRVEGSAAERASACPGSAGAAANAAWCLSGRENLCPRARFTGCDIDGGMAEYAVADARFCFPIPAGYPDDQAAPLMCAGLIGYRALRMCGDAQRIGLYGFGASAHILAQVCAAQGREVYAFTRDGDERRRRSRASSAPSGRAAPRSAAASRSTRRSSSRPSARSSRSRCAPSRRAGRSSAAAST